MVEIPTPKMIPLSECKVHPNNVKEHPDKQIKNLMKLIEWVGFKDPIVLDGDNTVRAGHGRLLAAEQLGMKEVPYVRLEGLTKKQMDLFIYMDNQINESPWIKENVHLLLKEIPMKDLQMFDVSWDGIKNQEVKEETVPIPEPPAVAKTKPGDIYIFGNHKLICGDATNPGTYQKLLASKCTIAFTSPPYNIGKTQQKYENNKDNMNQDDYLDFLKKFTWNMIENCEFGFVDIQQLAGNKLSFIEWLYHFKNNIVDRMIWNKKLGAPPRLKNVLNAAFEDIIIFADSEKATKRQITTAEFHGTVQSVYNGGPQRHNDYADIHKATFPLDLPFHFIKTFSKINDSILEPFAGTGTTFIAAEQLYRKCYGIELDPAYCDVIIERWENFTGNKAKLV